MDEIPGWDAFPAHTARFGLRIGDHWLPAIGLSGEESLYGPHRFEIRLALEADEVDRDWLGRSGFLELTGRDGAVRRIGGQVAAIEDGDPLPGGRWEARVEWVSQLAALARRRDARVILGAALSGILRELWARNGLVGEDLVFDLAADDPFRPYTVQARETDLEFWQRLLAGAGWFALSEVDGETGRERIRVVDHNARCPRLAGGLQAVRPEAGLDRPPGLMAWRLVRRRGAGRCRVTDPVCGQTVEVEAGDGNGPAVELHAPMFGGDPGAAERQARIQAQALAAGRRTLEARGDDVRPAAGSICAIDPGAGRTAGEWLLTALRHHARAAAGETLEAGMLDWRVELTAIPFETPFRRPPPSLPELPPWFSARIEADGPWACLDEAGCTRLRSLFDSAPHEHGHASVPLPRVQPAGGPPGDLPQGLTAPLRDGAEVLLTCLGGDPDRPMIVAGVPDADHPAPVGAANAALNLWQSAAGHALELDDTVDAPAVRLRSAGGVQILELDASACGHRLRLADPHGPQTWIAGGQQRIACGGNLNERIGSDRHHRVETDHRTRTAGGAIHHQAATGLRARARRRTRLEAGTRLELKTGRKLDISARRGARIRVRGPRGLQLRVDDGRVRLHAPGSIRIEGRGGGEIRFEQAGAGFAIDPAGQVRLYGGRLQIAAEGGVRLDGPVEWISGAPEIPPGASPAAPRAPEPIEPLADPGDLPPPALQDIEIEVTEAFLRELGSHLNPLMDLEYVIVTDTGERREGRVEDGWIRVPGLPVDQRFSLRLAEVAAARTDDGRSDGL